MTNFSSVLQDSTASVTNFVTASVLFFFLFACEWNGNTAFVPHKSGANLSGIHTVAVVPIISPERDNLSIRF